MADLDPSPDESDLGSAGRYCVVLLYYRYGERVLDTIAAVRAQTSGPVGLYLVDNCSSDGVVDRLEQRGDLDGVRIVRTEENLGYAGGMNVGARAASADGCEFLMFLTHELRMEARCAEELLAAAGSRDAVAAGPSLRLPDGSLWANGGTLDWRGRARHLRDDPGASPRGAQWLDGACLLVRSDAFAAVGGFDESYFLYWEDVAFSLALREVGTVLLVPGAVAVQSPSTSSGSAYYATRNRLVTWRRQGQPLKVLLSLPELLAWGVKRALTGGGRADLVAVLRGCRDGLRHRP
ncbi:glycosyltransferase family 2 protein [Nocardioides panacis]|uniref:Glycosyltransferase family 2 protein n=1 Tax=Nocardioides panacis TaxID=2849501 RepID=A0A975SY67_9ACTN|nr:glycosyltransferase family 2 protein [Nocardioides panacis]QWZ08143.1 glycosyltransferase family 2 protein [Nocardioides panacis]